MVEGTRFTQLGKLFWREFREHLQFILEKIVDVVIQWFRTVGLFCLSDVRVTISPLIINQLFSRLVLLYLYTYLTISNGISPVNSHMLETLLLCTQRWVNFLLYYLQILKYHTKLSSSYSRTRRHASIINNQYLFKWFVKQNVPLPGILMDMRTASLTGILGVVFTWQYSAFIVLTLVTITHNSMLNLW